MNSGKKVARKRKHPSPVPVRSKVGRRLEKLRGPQNDLWADDDEGEDDDFQQPVQPQPMTNNKTYIVLSDSDDEKRSSKHGHKSKKTSKQTRQSCPDHQMSDYENRETSKCVTCLICSIFSTLNSYNCCSKHLSLLMNNKNSHSSAPSTESWPPQHVMIVPMTDELVKRYMDPEQIHRLKSPSTMASTTDRLQPTRSLSKKTSIVSELSDPELSHVSKVKTANKSCMTNLDQSEQQSISSITAEQIGPAHSTAIPQDTTFTVVTSTSTSTTSNSFESPTVLDTCQLQQPSDQPVVSDESQKDQQQASKKSNDLWTPISDETYAAIEVVLEHIEQTPEEITEFTPATARRTSTAVMASRLPKIQLKKGRFHQGKPLPEKTSTDAPNGPRSSTTTAVQPAQSTSSSTMAVTSSRPAASLLATIVEDESLVLPPNTGSISNKSSNVLTERHENTTEGLSDTMMSCLFAQEEASQPDYLSVITKPISREALPPPTIVVEDYSHSNVINQLSDLSQCSQLTNDQNDTQQATPVIPVEKSTTPVRITYRTNPDGSRVSISRPSLPSNNPSPKITIHRMSIDGVSSTTQQLDK